MNRAHKPAMVDRWSADQWCRAQYGTLAFVFLGALVLAISRLVALLSA